MPRQMLAFAYCWRLGDVAAIVEEAVVSGRGPEVGDYPDDPTLDLDPDELAEELLRRLDEAAGLLNEEAVQ